MNRSTWISAPVPEPAVDRRLRRDLKTLAQFVELYCADQHKLVARQPRSLPGFDMHQLVGKEVVLCQDCNRLLAHALVMRSHCRMAPKPACKHCPACCYHPKYRAAIQQVMRYSGRKFVLSGRIDYLLHLLF